MEICKAEKKNSFVQEEDEDEEEVFNVYHQRIIGGKIAPYYVANVKIEKENVTLEIGTVTSVSISNKKTCDLICRNSSANLLPISSKLRSYSGELIHPLGEIVCKVNYKGQSCHHSFIIADDKRWNLLGRDMLRVIKIDWTDYICNTAKNPVISPNFLVWKFCGKGQFPHSFHTRKLGEITGFFAVQVTNL